MLALKVLNGPLKDKVFSVGKDEIFIGQESSNQICLQDLGVQPRHAVLFTLGDMCFLRDLKTENGTLVNGKRIQEDILDAGDKIKIGNVELVLEEGITGKAPAKGIQYDEEDAEEAEEVMELDQNAKRDKEAGSTEESAEAAARHIKALCNFSDEISDVKEHEQLLQAVLKTVAEAVSADNLYIFLKDRHGDLTPKAIFEKEKVKIAPVSRGIIRRTLKSNKTLMTTDASADSRFRDNLSIVRRKVKAVICAPLTARQQVMGAMYIGASGVVHRFTQQDMEFATVIARITALAIDDLRAHRKQARLLMNMMRSLVTTMEMSVPHTKGHAMRVASYAGAIAQARSLSSQKVYLCQLGGYLHDIGKIVDKTAGKTPDEQKKAYQEHVIIGEKIVLDLEGMQDLLPAIKYHHEYHDGTGFPEGLKGEQIPVVARIVGLANYFDHLLNDKREDGTTMELKDALKEIKDQAGKKFNADEVMALREACRQGEIKVVALPFVIGMDR